MWTDMIVGDLKKRSAEYAEKFDYDVHRLAEDMRKRCVAIGVKAVSREKFSAEEFSLVQAIERDQALRGNL